MFNWRGLKKTAEPPLLDTGYLDRLEMHLGEAVLTELMADGMLELSDRLDRVATAAADEDGDVVAHLCHDIASVAGHLGLSRLSAAAVDLNRVLRETAPPPPGCLTAPLSPVGAQSLDALGAHLGSRTDP